MIQGIKKVYRFRNEKRIIEYLHLHQNMLEFLLKASVEINKYFDGDVLLLETFTDPEDESGCEELIIVIQTDREVKDAMARMDEFEDKWLLHQSFLDIEHITISTEFNKEKK